jgi:hypothetical protein
MVGTRLPGKCVQRKRPKRIRRPCRCVWCCELRPHQARGFCVACYERWYRPKRAAAPDESTIPDRQRADHGEPVVANPGTEVKLRVLEQRAAEGRPLFNPLDRFLFEED